MRLLTLRSIVVATDLDASSDGAIDSARRLAGMSGAALHVVHVVPASDSTGAPRDHSAEHAVRDRLRRAGIADDHATVHVVPGAADEAIESIAELVAADAIVLGPHRHGRDDADRALGGTARAVAERASAPCLVTAEPLRLPLGHVLVPIDLSDTARGALLVGLSWASALRAREADRETTLDVLHVESGDAGDPDDAAAGATSVQRELELVRQGAGDWAGVVARGHTERGSDVAGVIAHHARETAADLVVLGSRGRGLRDGLGSVSASVVTRLRLPILLVPPTVWRAHAARP